MINKDDFKKKGDYTSIASSDLNKKNDSYFLKKIFDNAKEIITEKVNTKNINKDEYKKIEKDERYIKKEEKEGYISSFVNKFVNYEEKKDHSEDLRKIVNFDEFLNHKGEIFFSKEKDLVLKKFLYERIENLFNLINKEISKDKKNYNQEAINKKHNILKDLFLGMLDGKDIYVKMPSESKKVENNFPKLYKEFVILNKLINNYHYYLKEEIIDKEKYDTVFGEIEQLRKKNYNQIEINDRIKNLFKTYSKIFVDNFIQNEKGYLPNAVIHEFHVRRNFDDFKEIESEFKDSIRKNGNRRSLPKLQSSNIKGKEFKI